MGIFLGHVKYKVGWGIQGCKKRNQLVAENQIRMFACVESNLSPSFGWKTENRRNQRSETPVRGIFDGS